MFTGIDIRKALDTSSGTTGAVLIPDVVSEGIRMFVETRSPLWNIIPKAAADGNAYAYREQNGLPVASFGAELAALPAAQNATYVDRAVPIKSIYIRGEVSGQLIESSRTFLDVLDREINNSALGMIRTLEQKIVSGDSVANPNEFDGLAKWITTTVDLDTDAGAPVVPGELTLVALEELLAAAPGGDPTHLIMGRAMRRKLWSILQNNVQYIGGNGASIDGGFGIPAYGNIPIIELFDNTANDLRRACSHP
jgi:HK97 family phage major capsid protein